MIFSNLFSRNNSRHLSKQNSISTRHKPLVRIKNTTTGITLVALVVTIVVLLILAGITITMLFGENGIIKKAQQAAEATKNDQNTTEQGLKNLADQMNAALDNGSVTNPYADQEWVMAWTCTDGVWSDTINAGGTAEGDIVAKLYTTGNRITPPYTHVNSFGDLSFPEGDEYKLVVEGTGEMGALTNGVDSEIPTEAYAWQYASLLFVTGNSDTCITPYITEAIICDGITSIGNYAFLVGSSLKEVKLGKDIKTIGKYGINCCISLESIIIPDGVTEIGKNAFYGCTSLSSITIPRNVTSIEEDTFGSCTSLSSINIPNSVTSIGRLAFYHCNSLTNISIPNSVTSIGESAFSYCSSLTTVTIPNSVTIINQYAFQECSNLTNVTIPNSVTIIKWRVFSNCSVLNKIKIMIENADNVTIDDSSVFENIASDAVIYVLNEGMKTKISALGITNDIQVVTKDQMNSL